jgi:hypothetical protein
MTTRSSFLAKIDQNSLTEIHCSRRFLSAGGEAGRPSIVMRDFDGILPPAWRFPVRVSCQAACSRKPITNASKTRRKSMAFLPSDKWLWNPVLRCTRT